MSETPAETAEKIRTFAERFKKEWKVRPDMLALLTQEVILEMALHPQKGIPLGKIPEKLGGPEQLPFFRQVFSLHDRIPKLQLLKLWSTRTFLGLCGPLKKLPEEQLTQCRDSPFLIDSSQFRQWTCAHRGKGHELFRMTAPQHEKSLALPPPLLDAIRADSPDAFAIYRDMAGVKMSYSFLMQICRQEASHILHHLLTRNEIPPEVATVSGLCVLFVSQFSAEKAIPMLRALEEFQPGCIGDFRDPFGRNLLWYTVSNPAEVWFHPGSRLVPFLLEHGCSPENVNPIGLSWRYVMQNMTQTAKKKLWLRYPCQARFRFPRAGLAAAADCDPESMKAVAEWSGTEVPNHRMSVQKVKRLTRAGFGKPLHASERSALAAEFAALATPRPARPIAALPQSWLTAATGEIAQIPLKRKGKASNETPQEKALAVLRTGLLVYHPQVRAYFCRHALPGYRILRHIGGAAQTAPVYAGRDRYLPLIRNDDVAGFAGCCPADPAVLWGLAEDVLACDAAGILDWLLDGHPEFTKQHPPAELLFYGAANLPEAQAVSLFDAIEARWEGLLMQAKDCFGSGLLWYALFNPHLPQNREKSLLVKRLNKAYCRMNTLNGFALSPADLADAIADRNRAAGRKK